jgi:RsiW-degrading membrane proteinase PrsW (M82 family)
MNPVGLVLGVVFVTPLVVLYALFIRWCDRFEPEPWWLLLAAFLWGAIFATYGGGEMSSLVQGSIEIFTGQSRDALGATVLAPIFEEAFKGIGVALVAVVTVLGLKELDGPLDGAIYGGMIGLGFTLTEDILYVSRQYAVAGFGGLVVLLFMRTVLLGLSHCTFTALTGIGVGIAIEAKRRRTKLAAPLLGYLCAVALHALHNALPTFFGDEGLAALILVSWTFDLLFFLVLALLVTRDRAIVIRELLGEVGGLLHPRELKLVSSYLELGTKNLAVLLAQGFGPFQERRKKQLALVELAFLKNRRRRGEQGRSLDLREAELRADIARANARGTIIGA